MGAHLAWRRGGTPPQTAVMAFESVCVFAGSSPGARSSYAVAARALGSTLAAAGTRTVFGGASVGLMGAVADAALAAGGEVVGVIPEHLVAHEVAHPSLDMLEVVATMHDRKRRMADLADAFVVLPGGLGTLEEAFEVLTWTQLALHEKPLGFLNVDGYFAQLSDFLDHAAAERFVREEHRAMAAFDDDAPRLLRRLEAFEPPVGGKWIDR